MTKKVEVSLLTPKEWERLREIRIRALIENPEAFGANLTEVNAQSKEVWLKLFEKEDYLIASISGVDVGMLYIEVLKGDHGATCWIGGCWSDPHFRGQGAFSALFRFLDSLCESKGWQRQGLGVWTDNFSAIAAYKALGFIEVGERQESERRPGRFYIHMIRDSKAPSLD